MTPIPTRPAAVAGYFYPSDPVLLRLQIDGLLASAMPAEDGGGVPKALVVPHAGYIYSGAVAASGFSAARPLRETVRRVVLLGPAHRVPVARFALPAARAFATPLGEVPLSQPDWMTLQQDPDVVVDDLPHALEHSLEVQLPFLQVLLDNFEIVPLLVGHPSVDQVATRLERLWGGPETLIVISSDLSHYHTYNASRTIDRNTVTRMLELAPVLDGEQACGATAVNGLLSLASRKRLEPRLLDLRSSGDTAGDRKRVVGYASLAFFEPAETMHATLH